MVRRKLALAVFLTISVAWGLTGCSGGGGGGGGGTGTGAGTGGGGGAGGGGGKPSAINEVKPAGGGGAATGDASAGAAEGWGTIKGQIVFDGTPPEPKIIVKKGDPDAKDSATCAQADIVSEEFVVNSSNNGLKWVVVFLAGKPKVHPDLQKVEGRAELGQKGCHFIPHVLAMREGQKFIITSDDPIAHNTKGDPFKSPGFNPVVPPAIDKQSMLEGPDLVAETVPFPISCSIHPHMKAHLGVFNHPYFAVTDENGSFTIEKVPAGSQKLVIWHESSGYGEGGKAGKDVTVKADDTTDMGQTKYTPKK